MISVILIKRTKKNKTRKTRTRKTIKVGVSGEKKQLPQNCPWRDSAVLFAILYLSARQGSFVMRASLIYKRPESW